MVRPSDDRQRSPAPLAAIDPQQNDMHQLNNANIFTHTYSCTPDRGSVQSRSHSAGAVHTAPPYLSTPSFGLAALGCPSLKTRGRGPSLRPGRTSSPHPCRQQRSRSDPCRRPRHPHQSSTAPRHTASGLTPEPATAQISNHACNAESATWGTGLPAGRHPVGHMRTHHHNTSPAHTNLQT